ncbi:SRPBCC family protein [Bdellovibrio sp. SKB1291214]|uniref:SRPBCC family protein n=1 Tax=Bdellovibrio sp. SKB1291214 TaxID=1732569 RepID=UPI000B51A157|nr:SRPBCC family protein [Bdellovibrio sp. SKB1291214]UYL07996.1 SRPBCC family protein [Bdellovibrio sp. SKB1291214]
MENEFQRSTENKSKKTNPFRLTKIGNPEDGKVPHCTTINKSVEEVAALVGDVSNLPQFFEGLEKVEMEGLRASWQFRKASESSSLSMRLTEDRTARSWTWEADDSAGFDYSIVIKLDKAQANRGTIVQMKVEYDNKFTGALAAFEKIFGGKDADTTAKVNLQRLKAFCETGSVPTIEGQPSGREEDSKELKH